MIARPLVEALGAQGLQVIGAAQEKGAVEHVAIF